MMNRSEETKAAFTPNALIHTFANSVTSPVLNRTLLLKGVYKLGKGGNYSGMYYDILKDEFSDAAITLVIPEAIRRQLKDGQLIEGNIFLNKRILQNSGRIDLLAHLTELVARQEKVIDVTEQKALALIQQKAKAGYRDVAGYIKQKLYAQEPIRIKILIGLTAIIDEDIKHQIKDATVAYNIQYIRINLTQVQEIVKAMDVHQDCDILILSRGGGENIQVFNNLQLTETALQLHPYFVTAIGHSSDEPLLQQVADKSFITPTSLGQFLYDQYIQTLDDLNHSKAKMISDITKQVELNFQHTVNSLNSKLSDTSRILEETRMQAYTQAQRFEKKLRFEKIINKALAVTAIVLALACVLLLLFRK